MKSNKGKKSHDDLPMSYERDGGNEKQTKLGIRYISYPLAIVENKDNDHVVHCNIIFLTINLILYVN